MIGEICKVAGLLLSSACSYNYFKKFFVTADKRQCYARDANGRIIIWHGVNVSNYSKAAPFLPWQTKEDFTRLKEWGFNFVRYLVFWQAVEPTEGNYDIVYIQKTKERLQWLNDLGIDVMLDVHQDLYTTRFTGNGFPDWTVHDGGVPFNQRTPWNLNYFEPAVINSYNWFWKDMELQTRYIKMVNFLLSNFDNNIVGIDVMNEPFLGTTCSFEKSVLTYFYNQIHNMMIRGNYKARMFFEPMIYTSAGIPSALNFYPNLNGVYAPHYYDAFCHEGGNYDMAARWRLKRSLDIKRQEANNFLSPLLFGEFGISPSIKNYLRYIKDFVTLANNISWCYYTYDRTALDDFGIIDNDGKILPAGVMLQVIYPQRIAGNNPSMTDTDTEFILEYDVDKNIKGNTEIFIPFKGITIHENDGQSHQRIVIKKEWML